jgi:hypothetical protein
LRKRSAKVIAGRSQPDGLQVAAHRFGERRRIEWLGDHRDSTERRQLFDLGRLGAGGHENNRDLRRASVFAQARNHRRFLHIRHHDIAEDQVGYPVGRHRQRLFPAGAGLQHERRIKTEGKLHDVPHERIIVDMKNTKRAHVASYWLHAQERSKTDQESSDGLPPLNINFSPVWRFRMIAYAVCVHCVERIFAFAKYAKGNAVGK